MISLMTTLQNWYTDDEEGASMVEYVLLASLVAAVVVAGLLVFGPGVRDSLFNTGSEVANA